VKTAFATGLDTLFADPHLARHVVYTAQGGVPTLVRAILRRPDDATGFGETRIWTETTRLDLRVAEVSAPGPGDRIEIDGEAYLIQGEPVRDTERLIWTVNLRSA
jgi:hypothetical protein